MADGRVLVELQVLQKGDKLSIITKDTEKLSKTQDRLNTSTKNLTKTQDTNYTRTKQGVIQTANSTKNFSKMQQSIDGGGGAGGLVRAYALLAANVFALSAAFGILSRGAQVDTLIDSMKQLEIVSGKSIRSTARDLQEAAGYGLDFAAAMRSTSLALSAGFGTEQISELATVARNAAVSLGRNMPDALDRIFRGVIKVEPELLDEIGLFVRVNDAAAKYASQLGVSAGSLTEFQKRQAFLTESIRQGTEKFEAFSEVETDPFSKLQTTFTDITQGILSFINKGLLPVIEFFAENKLIFTTIFAAVATTLIRMAIPAMGAFTQSVATSAAESAKAAANAIKDAQLKGQIAEAEHKKELVRRKEILEAEALEKRFVGKPQELKVRGRDKSKALEAALQKQEVTGNQRILIIKQRLDDIDSNRGKKARERNTLIQAEKQALKEELAILERIQVTQKEINTQGFTGIKSGSVADRRQREAAGKAIRAQGIANVATIAETQGVTAAFQNLGRQLSIVSTQSKAANASFGVLRKSLFAVRGAAVIAATGFQALWMSIMGPLSVILILLPALQGLAKWFGFSGQAEQKLSEANRNASETFELLGARIAHAKKELAKFQAQGTGKGALEARLALKETILSTTEALDEQIKAIENYESATKPSVQAINKTLTFLNPFRDTARAQLRKNQIQFIKEIQGTSKQLTPTMEKLIATYKKNPFNAEARQKIIDQAKTEADAYKNVKSSVDGAVDSARKFSDSLIVSTQVDQPLASFKQLNASLANQNLTLEEQKEITKTIANDAAIRAMLTEDQRKSLEATTNEVDKFKVILKEVEDSYSRQQEILIRMKTDLAQISTLQNQIKNATKASTAAVIFQFDLVNKQRRIEREAMEFEFQRRVTMTGLTTERVKQLATVGSLVGREEELGLKAESLIQVQSAINELRNIENFEIEESVRKATESLRLEQEILKVQQNLLSNEIRLNTERAKAEKLRATLAAFASRGSTALTSAETFNSIKKQEEERRKTVEEEKETKKRLAQIEFEILEVTLKTLQYRMEIVRKEEALMQKQQINALERSLGLDSISDPESLKAAKEFLKQSGKGNQVDLLESLYAKQGMTEDPTLAGITESIKAIGDASLNAVKAIDEEFENKGLEYANSLAANFTKAFAGSKAGEELFSSFTNLMSAPEQIQEMMRLTDANGEKLFNEEMLQLKLFETMLMDFANQMESIFGENGAFVATMARASANMLSITTNLQEALQEAADNSMQKSAAVATAIAGSLSQLSSVFSSYMQQRISEIDQLIEAEKNRDGKSKESVARIAALEKKKDAMKKKEFETNKKLMMAQIVASTAAGVMGAMAIRSIYELPFATAAAYMIGAMGVAQLALVSKLKYNSAPTSAAASQPTELTIGKRSDAVDVSQSATSGELNYLRGGRTTGSNLGGAGASFPGAAMGRRGYADGGVVVGERGPEVITPAAPVDVTPNYALGRGASNVNFTINAVDAAGVEDVLMNQRGNIIRMIREAANENGTMFLEEIDTQAYGSSR